MTTAETPSGGMTPGWAKDIGKQQMMLLLHRKMNRTLPAAVDALFQMHDPRRVTRSTQHFHEMFTEKLYRTYTIRWAGPRLWNSIISPMFSNIQTVPTSKIGIKKTIKGHFLNTY